MTNDDETLYIKKGRRYKPWGMIYALGGLPQGTHLVVVKPGSQSMLYNVEPDRAALLAAMREATEAMIDAMREASELQPQQAPITQEQRDLLDKLKATGFNASIWSRGGLHDMVYAGMKALESRHD